MLSQYFIRPSTVDQIHASWIGEEIEAYVVWLTEQKYAAGNMAFRVPVLVRFGEFAQTSGANNLEELLAHIESFIEDWLSRRKRASSGTQRSIAARELRQSDPAASPLESPALRRCSCGHTESVCRRGARIFDFLLQERGLRTTTLVQYRHYLQRLQDYLRRLGAQPLRIGTLQIRRPLFQVRARALSAGREPTGRRRLTDR